MIASSASIGPPQSCISAPTRQPNQRRREQLYNGLKTISSRGNPICYYLESQLSDLITTTAPSLEFIVPAGVWAVRWELMRARGSFPAVDGIHL